MQFYTHLLTSRYRPLGQLPTHVEPDLSVPRGQVKQLVTDPAQVKQIGSQMSHVELTELETDTRAGHLSTQLFRYLKALGEQVRHWVSEEQ